MRTMSVQGTDRATRWPAWLGRDRVLFAAALVVRLGLVGAFLHFRGQPSGLELGKVAANIVAGDGFMCIFYGTEFPPGEPVPRYSFFPPLYPHLMALLKITTGAGWIVALQVVQAIVGATLPLVVRRLGERLMPVEPAWAAAWLTVIWPPCVIYTAQAFPVTFHAVGVPALLLAWVIAARSPRPARAAGLVGLSYGLLAYSLPSFLGSLVVMPFGLRTSGLSWRRSFGMPALALVVALVTLSPWTVRNAIVQERFVPVATNLGFNLLGANNADSRPYTNVLCAHEDIRWRHIDRALLETMNEADFDRLMLRQGLSYMLAHPGESVRRIGTRIVYYWWISPEIVRYSRLQGLGGLALMSVLLPLTVVGWVVAWRRRRAVPWGVLLAACVWMTLFYMNFAVRGRYSLAIQPVMLIFGVLGAAALIGWWGRRRAGNGHRRLSD